MVAFWLSHLQPETHCPFQMERWLFQQLAMDLDVPHLLHRLQEIEYAWYNEVDASHTTKRAMQAAGVDYMRTGYAILSLCLPNDCRFAGRPPSTESLVGIYRTCRRLPKHTQDPGRGGIIRDMGSCDHR